MPPIYSLTEVRPVGPSRVVAELGKPLANMAARGPVLAIVPKGDGYYSIFCAADLHQPPLEDHDEDAVAGGPENGPQENRDEEL
jgi:hypothetical protein